MKALVRLSPDLTTKGAATRSRFAKRLAHNLEAACSALELRATLDRAYSRIYVDYEDPRVIEVCRRTFGVHSVAVCDEAELSDLDALVAFGVTAASSHVAGRTFAVRARVRSDVAAFGSPEVNVALGRALSAVGTVELEKPEVTVRVEVRDRRVFVFQDFLRGEGGLPLGVAGRAVSLISGGFDSAVASYLAMRRGVSLDFVCCRLGGEAHERGVRDVVDILATRWSAGQSLRLWIVPFEETVEQLRRHVRGRFQQLVLKRLMVRVAEVVAFKRKCDAIITGECIGQVSSQTLRNLRALGDRGRFPVLRPVLTFDKDEIIELARHVGTFDRSATVPEYCALDAGKPATGASHEQLAEQEARVPFDPYVLIRASERIDRSTPLALPSGLVVDDVRSTDTLLDLRSPPAQRRDPMPGALIVDPLDVLENPAQLTAGGRFVVVCEQGARSLWFARRLRDLGFEAFSLSRSGQRATEESVARGSRSEHVLTT